MPLKKYDQTFLKKEEEKEALKECYFDPFMGGGHSPIFQWIVSFEIHGGPAGPPGYFGPPRLGEIQ